MNNLLSDWNTSPSHTACVRLRKFASHWANKYIPPYSPLSASMCHFPRHWFETSIHQTCWRFVWHLSGWPSSIAEHPSSGSTPAFVLRHLPWNSVCSTTQTATVCASASSDSHQDRVLSALWSSRPYAPPLGTINRYVPWYRVKIAVRDSRLVCIRLVPAKVKLSIFRSYEMLRCYNGNSFAP